MAQLRFRVPPSRRPCKADAQRKERTMRPMSAIRPSHSAPSPWSSQRRRRRSRRLRVRWAGRVPPARSRAGAARKRSPSTTAGATRHRRHGRHYGYPRHRPNRHRPYRHRPNRPLSLLGISLLGLPPPLCRRRAVAAGALAPPSSPAAPGATAIRCRATVMSAAGAGSRSSCRCPIRRAITGSGPDPVRRIQPRFRARALRASRLRVSTPSAKAMAKYR